MNFIIILLGIIAMLIVKIYRLKKKNKILYNNYHVALNILAEYDSKLKSYLERNDNKWLK